MERSKLPDGLVWRKKPEGSYFEDIYFNKQHRSRRIRGSSGTSDPKEAERRLRLRLQEIDNAELYGLRPTRTFSEASAKAIDECKGAEATVRSYAEQADLLAPYIGDVALRLISKDRLREFIEARRKKGVSVRTINISLGFVRRVLRLAAYYWRDENGMSWLENCPIISFEKGQKKLPYPLSDEEQERLFDALPGRMRKMAIFAVNTGLRDKALRSLRWSWETFSAVLGETVIEIPGPYMKNGKPMTLIMNRAARQAMEGMRGYHEELVFGLMSQMTNNSWNQAWRDSKLPAGKEYLKGVHNLRHTFAKRLRDVGVDERDIQDLLHHLPRNVTRHYSAPELKNLKACLEKLVGRRSVLQAVA